MAMLWFDLWLGSAWPPALVVDGVSLIVVNEASPSCVDEVLLVVSAVDALAVSGDVPVVLVPSEECLTPVLPVASLLCAVEAVKAGFGFVVLDGFGDVGHSLWSEANTVSVAVFTTVEISNNSEVESWDD